MANDIAVSMYLNNKQYMQSMNASKGALLIYNKQVGLSQKTMQHFEQTMNRSSRSMRMNQSVISNGIFLVEDMASVYGTMGLAGAIRAGSNNLTMMAAAFGPWAMAGTVAVTTITQLWLALTKEEKNAKDEADNYQDALDEQMGKIDRMTRLRRQLSRASESSETSSLKQNAEDDLASIKNQIAALEEQRAILNTPDVQLLKRAKMFEEAAKDNPYSAAAKAANNLYNQIKDRQQAESNMQALNEKKYQSLLKERSDKEEELALIRKKNNALVQQEVIKANQEQIAAVEEQIRKDQELTQNKLHNQKQIADAKRKDTQRNDRRDEFQRRPNNPSGARMGDREFADSMARARRQGFVDPKLSEREQQSVDTLRANKDRLQRDDMRGTFDKQRQQQIDDINKQIAAVFDKARGQAKGEMDKQTARDEKQASLEKATQDNTNQQHKTRESLDKLTQEIERAIERQSSGQSGTLVQLGGLSL